MILPLDLLWRFGVALFIGFLIGLEREYSHGKPNRELIAGARTFALLSLVGSIAALTVDILETPLIFLGVFLSLTALMVTAYVIQVKISSGRVGQTTEVSALITILLGALCYWDYMALAVAIAVAVTVLLSLKPQTRRLIKQLTREDVYATLKFAVITAIILPVLPNQTFGPPPLNVLNPYTIWLMVVLVSGVSFLGYVLIKVVGAERGIGLAGLMGGLVSSTAVTVSFAQRSRKGEDLLKPFALAISIAWAVMFLRVLVIVSVLNLKLLNSLWLPLLAAALPGAVYSLFLYRSQRSDDLHEVPVSNPFYLEPALKFGAFYVLILLVISLSRSNLGNPGIYLSSLVGGVASVDAIVVSMANLSQGATPLDEAIASRSIMLATLSNTLFKAGILLVAGDQRLFRIIFPVALVTFLIGLGVAFWYL